ncbi:hypothetical protein T552_01950 [Pneumocystis carinii B80]|uniref:Translation machinery-associated protein 22 n=1 Tax=Pneumocystis carinii (strain B80) TaxID=1408658 RepID=A0A0W4ZI93_PNEC8|nr:hypothetical protein T552_01950 [Pneumocystis carinii B80]KTW28089.1 hypothetical protein T552_01950 [Pneumocystis carinii B80]
MIQEIESQESDALSEVVKKAKDVIYCGVCSFPPEYCEYGNFTDKCMEWLKKNHTELYIRLYSGDSLIIEKQNTISEEKEKIDENDKIQTKEKIKGLKKTKKNTVSKVLLRRLERNRKKYVISVQGLELYGIDVKKAAKLLGKKFATGSSVTKNGCDVDELVIQGDYIDEIYAYILETYPEISEEDIECYKDKQKKK